MVACTIHDRVLNGMGAIVMDGAISTPLDIIAAGAVCLGNRAWKQIQSMQEMPAKR